MNEEIEYAEMLEIPVSTVNLVKRKRRGKKEDLKLRAIEQVNDKLEEEGVESIEVEPQNEANTLLLEEEKPKKDLSKRILAVEFAGICALCGTIFLTNVFMPNSAINTFFRSFQEEKVAVDKRVYSDFSLSSLFNEYEKGAVKTENGIVFLTLEGCIYSPADGTLVLKEKKQDGWRVRVKYSPQFYAEFENLDECYYEEQGEVKANIPLGYTFGEKEVEVRFYGGGELLDCFTMAEGKPVWAEE